MSAHRPAVHSDLRPLRAILRGRHTPVCCRPPRGPHGAVGWEIQAMRLYSDPRSPYLFYDFNYRGKRHPGSNDEKSKSAAEKVATNHLAKLMAGDPDAKRNHQAPTLQEFSERFFTWAKNSGTLEVNTLKYYEYGWRLLSFSILAGTPIDQIDSEIIDTTKFQRPVINRRTGKVTDVWVDCSKTYTQQAQRTLRVMLGKGTEWRLLKTRVSFKIAKTPARSGVITPEVEEIILRELSGYRTRRPWLVIITMQDTGARPSEG